MDRIVRKININQNVILLSKPMPFLKPENIMKNVKNLFEEFQKEAKLRIENGDFKVTRAKPSSNGYLGEIEISIDGILFKFSLHPNKFVCEHGHVEIYGHNIPYKQFKVLKKAYFDNSRESTEKEIAELRDRIKQLKNESNII